MIMDPERLRPYVGVPAEPALQLDEPRARAVARMLDELRRLAREADVSRGGVAA